jgi:hypothetical protein
MSHVFVSYASENRDYVLHLKEMLEKNDYNVWVDSERIGGGKHWPSTIQSAIDEAYAVIVVMTPEGENSEWIGNEIAYAQELNKPIIPLLREGPLWFVFKTRQYVNALSSSLTNPAPDSLYTALLEHAPHELDSQLKVKLDEFNGQQRRVIPELKRLASNPYSPRSEAAREQLRKLASVNESMTPAEGMTVKKGPANVTKGARLWPVLAVAVLSIVATWFVTRSTIMSPPMPPLQEVFPQASSAEYFSFYGNGASFEEQFTTQCAHSGSYGLRLRYAMADQAFGGWGVRWDDAPGGFFEGSEFSAISFWVKGSPRSETFQIGVKDATHEVKLESKDFITVSSNEWKQVTVKISSFAGITSERIANVNIGFHAGHGTGTLCIDDLAFVR